MLFEMPKEKSKQVTFTLNQSLVDEISLRSSRKMVSKSAYLRLALLDYFRKEDNVHK